MKGVHPVQGEPDRRVTHAQLTRRGKGGTGHDSGWLRDLLSSSWPHRDFEKRHIPISNTWAQLVPPLVRPSECSSMSQKKGSDTGLWPEVGS